MGIGARITTNATVEFVLVAFALLGSKAKIVTTVANAAMVKFALTSCVCNLWKREILANMTTNANRSNAVEVG